MDNIDVDLRHYGILGMKWGKRKAVDASRDSDDYTKAKAVKKKKIREMSNEELKTLTTRMQLERQYKELRKNELSVGRNAATSFLASIGKDILRDEVRAQAKTFMSALRKK